MVKKSSKLFVGMDVHKDSIDVATGDEGGGEVRHYGAVGGDRAAVSRLVRKLEAAGKALVFVYEAGPCGFGIYRLLRGRGHECWVVSPGLTPRSNADRVKTDRRDCLKLCRLARAGELPSENSTGNRRRQGAITKTGNSSARRALVEAAWAYRYPARVSVGIARRQSDLSTAITDLAWKAQLRLCARYRRLSARGLPRNKIIVAIARELSGFVWALGQQVKPN